ncbi:transcriptional regulator, TetR family [Streptomyces prasinopilosus]|uniref:Transcriptional regulator, TetR family n=2 Tax=Streptomyces prasinopilosus TaxID=67344 RepID=A0A1G6M9S0_9ACTN|nr:transcriptional regulator, TetR family [Streptomyces prasinopilosus]
MPSAEPPHRLDDWYRGDGQWGGLLEPGRFPPPAGRGAPPPPEGRGAPGPARRTARMQYVRGMSQSAKSSRTPATTEPPERAAGSRAAAQRLKMRRELAAAAMELFATKGYEATTVDEIAAAAGVARRTFFRHFRSKEEAIFPDHDDTLVRAEAVLNAAPAHEHPLDTVCRGIKEVMRMYAARPEISVARYRLTREVPTLREAEIASVARYERLFTRYLLGHFDEHAHEEDAGDDPLLAEVAASAVVTAHNHVLRRWLRADGRGDVEAELDHAFSIVRKTFGNGIMAGRRTAPPKPPAASVSDRGEVLVAVARTDAPLDEVMRTIERALKDH